MTPRTALRILAGLPLGEAVDERSPFIRFPGDVPIWLVGSSGNPGWSYDTHLIRAAGQGAVVANDRVEPAYEDLVRLYLIDIGQYTLLTKDDEVRLAKAIEAGKEAIEAFNAGGKDVTATPQA